jgi:hypothetical protein
VAAFLDVSGAYDNVFIDFLCSVMLDKELPCFYVGGVECMILTGYKGLPQGSVLTF